MSGPCLWHLGHADCRLTKQYEGGSIKCGNYWKDEHYGPLHVKLETQTGGEDTKPEGATGFDFGIAAQQETKHDAAPVNIIRTFSLSRDDKNESPRRVVQIQCTSWPDFDVPDTPEILLNLMHDVDTASRQTCTAVDVDDRADHPPVLVHCKSSSPHFSRRGSSLTYRFGGYRAYWDVHRCRCHH